MDSFLCETAVNNPVSHVSMSIEEKSWAARKFRKAFTNCPFGVPHLSFICVYLSLYAQINSQFSNLLLCYFKSERFLWPNKAVSKSCLRALLMKSISPPFLIVHN